MSSEGRESFERIPRVDAVELRKLLAGPEPPILVDVRPARERAVTRLPDDLWLPPERLEEAPALLPRNRPVVIYGHRGDDAAELALRLEKLRPGSVGLLDGGVEAYARWIDPGQVRYRDDLGATLRVEQCANLGSGCLTYILWDAASGDAVLVDPGVETERYLHAVRSRGLRVRAIVETHTHADHLSGHAVRHARTDAPIHVGHRSGAQYPHVSLVEGQSIPFGGEALTVWETPGHTRDHLSLVVRDLVLTGDTLLPGSCGRSDLGDGDPELLWSSLHDRLLRLPDATEVLPAHFGPLHGLPVPERFSTTIGFERATNEAVRTADRPSFLAYMRDGWPPKPARFDEIVRANLAE